MTRKKLLAIGDCNTLGTGSCLENSYPERVGRMLDLDAINCGYTMATTREGLSLMRDNFKQGQEISLLLIQFGLVDSYPTFKYSPYIVYYPDNFLRKQLRSIVKKYKKTCRKYGMNAKFGEKNVTPASDYIANIGKMLVQAGETTTFLIETIPNKQPGRNHHIRHYNSLLSAFAGQFPHCFKIDLFDDFMNNLDLFYQDETHCNDAGYDYITQKIFQALT